MKELSSTNGSEVALGLTFDGLIWGIPYPFYDRFYMFPECLRNTSNLANPARNASHTGSLPLNSKGKLQMTFSSSS